MMVSTFAQQQHVQARQIDIEKQVDLSIQSYGKELDQAIKIIEHDKKGTPPWNDDDISSFAQAVGTIPRVVLKNPYALAMAWYVKNHRDYDIDMDSFQIELTNKRTLTGQDVKKYMLLFPDEKENARKK